MHERGVPEVDAEQTEVSPPRADTAHALPQGGRHAPTPGMEQRYTNQLP